MFSQLYKKNLLPYSILAAVTIASTFILWLPFILRSPTINGVATKQISFQTVLSNWDGPLYIIPAKTLYDKNSQILKKSPLGISAKYFAAHLPLYPLTIKLIAPFFGYPRATATSTLLTSVILICFFYYFVEKLKLSKNPLLLSLVFLFITPRFLIVRSVGSPEPLFILLFLASIYFFIKERYLWSGIFGALAVITKTPGILLFVSYGLLVTSYWLKNKKFNSQWLWLLLIPLGLFMVFLLYYYQYGDFFAYFHSGDNLHLIFPPFSVFNYQKLWVGTVWLEEIIFLYFFYLITVIRFSPIEKEDHSLISERVKKTLFSVSLIFFISITMVQHRDISRYSLPLLPLALIGYEKFFTSKKFLIALIILIPAIYFYAWNFMLVNVAPIGDWSPFL